VVWFGPFHSISPGTGARHDQQAEAQRAQLGALGVRWVDTRGFLHGDHTADGVHFTGSGYAKLASAMLAALRDAGKSEGWLLAGAVLLVWYFVRRR
jgi:lysophospholipase L1-like esterase